MINVPRIIAVVSGKGGVGKTTLVSNLGIALSHLGKKVTLVDCNVTASHLGFCFGFYYYPKTLNHVLKGEASISEAIYQTSGIDIIPASLSLEDLIGLDMENLRSFLKGIESDIVILDSAPGLGREPLSVLRASDEIIFVTIPYMNAIADVIRCYKVVERFGINVLGIVLNMVKGHSYELKSSEVEKLTDLPVIAEIPYDENITRSLAVGRSMLEFAPYSLPSILIKRLAADLIGTYYVPQREGFFSRMRVAFRRLTSRKKVVKLKKLI